MKCFLSCLMLFFSLFQLSKVGQKKIFFRKGTGWSISFHDSLIEEMPKTELVLNFLEFSTHISPEKIHIFNLDLNSQLKKLCCKKSVLTLISSICSLRQNLDRRVLSKNCHCLLKTSNIKKHVYPKTLDGFLLSSSQSLVINFGQTIPLEKY